MVGAYWYSDAFNGSEAREEVSFISNSSEWKALKDAGITLDLPFYIDYEDPWILKNNHSTYDSRTDAVRSGMVAVEQMLGTATGFYASESWMKTQFDGAGLMNEGYNAWVAHWGSSQGMGNVQMWQYSNAGSVPGISTNVDLNWLYPSGAGGQRLQRRHGFQQRQHHGVGREHEQKRHGQHHRNFEKDCGQRGGRIHQCPAQRGRQAQPVPGAGRGGALLAIYQIRHGGIYAQRGACQQLQQRDISAVESVKDVLVKYNGDVANTAYGGCAAEKNQFGCQHGVGQLCLPGRVWTARSRQKLPPPVLPPGLPPSGDNAQQCHQNGGRTVFKAYESRPESWITEIHTDANGYVDYAVVCGQRITGGRFYENC